jgi:hypothetical protein
MDNLNYLAIIVGRRVPRLRVRTRVVRFAYHSDEE